VPVPAKRIEGRRLAEEAAIVNAVIPGKSRGDGRLSIRQAQFPRHAGDVTRFRRVSRWLA
jgi:hypothetical protein